jgi:phosphotriesterase-related protein
MIEAGLLERVLLSHDAGWYTVGEANGGDYRGYSTLFKRLLPALRDAGVTQAQVDTLVVGNPAQAFAVRVRSLNE